MVYFHWEADFAIVLINSNTKEVKNRGHDEPNDPPTGTNELIYHNLAWFRDVATPRECPDKIIPLSLKG